MPTRAHTLLLALSTALLAIGVAACCGGTDLPPETPDVAGPPGPDAASVDDKADDKGGEDETEPVETSSPAKRENLPAGEMTVATFKGLGNGLAPVIDKERGILVVEYFTEPAERYDRLDKDGVVAISRRLCGRPLEHWIQKLQRDIQSRVEMAEDAGEDVDMMRCTKNVCEHEAEMEWDVSGTWTFHQHADGRPILDSIVHVEGGPVDESFRTRGFRWARKEVERLGAGSCKGESEEINRHLYVVCNTAGDRSPGLPIREEPNWSPDLEELRPGAETTDGTLVEDLGGRKGEWWKVQTLDERRDVGWVVSVNGDKDSPQKGKPTLCRAR